MYGYNFKVMNMFSKELQLMDRNTAKYMIDELQEELDTTKEELDTTKEELDTTKEQLDVANSKIIEKDDTISSQADEIMRLKQLLAENGITE